MNTYRLVYQHPDTMESGSENVEAETPQAAAEILWKRMPEVSITAAYLRLDLRASIKPTRTSPSSSTARTA